MGKLYTNLLAQIEQYCRDNNLSVTRFGRDVMKDPNFVRELRAGRMPRKKVAQRVCRVLNRK